MSIAVALAACSSAGTTGTVPSAANGQQQSVADGLGAVLDSAPEAAGGRVLIQKLSIHPKGGVPAILINFLANGPNQAGVPCIDCVNGASTQDNVGLTGPQNYVLTNFVWQYGISFTDISYKGKCRLAWAITAGKKIIDSFSAKLTLTSSGGYVLYALARPRPKYSGAATETGRVSCGKGSQSLQVPLYFE
ncbi:MAG: hypothetical protein JO113_08870 [Candidatus Eremiobacteraeota bacterium]|nr:hypothetical protein [Candidatus Eremiobacteraeota bacterium]